MLWNQKIYIISRRDLSAGAQAVQACHSFREFIKLHPTAEMEWYKGSNHMCFLSVPDEKALAQLIEQAHGLQIRWAAFREPDLDGQITAVTLEASEPSRRLCEQLPLALVEYSEKK